MFNRDWARRVLGQGAVVLLVTDGLDREGARGLSEAMEGRNDVIVAGTLIAREIMAHFRFDAMRVSERGLRYGVALREAERLQG